MFLLLCYRVFVLDFLLIFFDFFFFKQKTAYEMRISDWSSDVCSSDLHSPLYRGEGVAPEVHLITLPERLKQQLQLDFFCCIFDLCVHRGIHTLRSEEHTSELQSLMRISYAVFCLKKKTTQKHTHSNNI